MDPNIAKLLEDNFDSPDGDDDDIDEAGLEDELADVLTGKAKAPPPAPKPKLGKLGKKPAGIKNGAPGQKPPGEEEEGEGVPGLDMDNIQNLLKSFDADDGDDEEIDENDPELLSELANVIESPMPGPKKRTPKKPASNSLPAPIQPMPAPMPVPIQQEIPVQSEEPEPEESKPSEKEINMTKIKNLQIEYKRAALKAKTNNDKNAALTYLKVSKQLDAILSALDSGEEVDLSTLPPAPQDLPIPAPQPPPAEMKLDPEYEMNQDEASKIFNAPTSAGTVLEALEQRLAKFQSTKEQAEAEGNGNKARRLGRIIKQVQTAIKDHKAGKPVDFEALPCPPGFPPIPVDKPKPVPAPVPAPVAPKRPAPMIPQKQAAPSPVAQTEGEEIDPATLEMNPEEASKLFNAPTSAGSILEALEQRLAKFKSTKEQAVADGNANKARRLGRIVTQVEKAIKDHKAGKPVDFESLPCPPGFPPIPVDKPAASAPAQKPQAPAAVPSRPPLKKQMSTSASKQLNYLLQRQKLFREAAIEAKKRGEIEQAKEYLRNAKGFDNLIEATKSGLPIDAASIPTPPQLSEDFLVTAEQDDEDGGFELIPGSIGKSQFDIDRDEMYEKIAGELKKQMEMCIRNREYFLKMGDIPTSSKFEKYASESKKDLHMLLIRRKNGDPIPSYRTETRTFSIVVANLDVPLNELHVEVIRAFDFTGTPQIDTYVRADFPFPNDNPQWKRTKTFYDSLEPEYNDTLFFQIDRKSRALPRILKRHPLKLTVYAKGCVFGNNCCCSSWFENFNCSGFLRSDNPIGTVLVKLDELENKCTIHECSSWTQGRKVINGKLEVKVKIREPLLAKQIEEIKEKWIVFE